ncbi:MAG: PLP-dependent aminotransferase family protein [Anaerolineales bacterium]|nr:PLP-dependent aminotransferase family protein [Anaerolineales bacterium]
MLTIPPSTQLTLRPGFIEFIWGQPDPDLLPVDALRRITPEALNRFGAEALAYGAAAGAGPLLAWIADRIRTREGVPISLEELTGSAGNSDALDQICTLFTRPGDVALVESPTYHLALRIMLDHGLDLRPVRLDEHGLDVAALEATLAALRAEGKTPRLLYTIPTFHNPMGLSLSQERRRVLVTLAEREGFLIVEDDVYRELVYDGEAPPSLWSLAPRGPVLRLGSFAKSLAPGLRLGFISGHPEHIRRIVDSGLRDSGGGVNHYTAMVVGALCAAGEFEKQVERLRAEYRARRDALLDALAEFMPAGVTWTKPAGGFFVWVTLPDELDAAALLPAAEARRVSYIPGARFCPDGGGRNALRLAFSLHKPPELVEGVRRLAQIIDMARPSRRS